MHLCVQCKYAVMECYLFSSSIHSFVRLFERSIHPNDYCCTHFGAKPIELEALSYTATLDVNLNCRVISENKFSIRFDKKPPEPRKCATCTNRSIGCMQLLARRTELFLFLFRNCEENVETRLNTEKLGSFLPFDWLRVYFPSWSLVFAALRLVTLWS